MSARLRTAAFLAISPFLIGLAPRAASAEAPAIEHRGVGCIVAGKYPRMDACFVPTEVVQTRVYFRVQGTDPWYYVEMKPVPAVSAQPGCLSGALPRPAKKLVGQHVEYYLEASDTAFNPGRTPEYDPLVVRSARECKKDVPVAPISATGPARVFPAMPAGFAAGGGVGTTAVIGGLLGAGAIAGGTVALVNGDEAQHALQVARAGNGSGTVTSTPPGVTCGPTCAANYPEGTQVRLTATPDAGSSFAGWEGACTGNGECLVTMDGPKSVTARFGTRVALTVVKAGTGSGTVTSAPGGIDCGAGCTASYDGGTTVVLTAVAAPGSTFAGWSGGGCSGTGPCTVVMDAARTVTANFSAAGVRLTVVKQGSGSGTVVSDPAGIDCGAFCTSGFQLGSSVTLHATPASGSTFEGWSHAGCGTAPECTVFMDSAKAVVATFGGRFTLKVSATGTGSGVVTSAPAGINCSVGDVGTCSAAYPEGALVELTATAQAGTVFKSWGGDCAGVVGNQCVLTMDAAKNVTADFQGGFTLTVVKTGNGTGLVTSSPPPIDCLVICSAQFPAGTVVTLFAEALAGSTFTGWSGSGCSGTGTCTVVMDQNRTVNADFQLITHRLSLTATTCAFTGCGGTVTSSSSPSQPGEPRINCTTPPTPNLCTTTYLDGVTVTLTAVPNVRMAVTWGGDCAGNLGLTCTLLMDATKTATADFQPPPIPLAQKAPDTDASPSGPALAWTSLLDVPGGQGQVLFNARESRFAGRGLSRMTASARTGENRVDARLQAGTAAGTWRFEIVDKRSLEPGSLRVLQGDPVVVLPDAIVFRVAGRSGEQVSFTYRVTAPNP